VNAALFAGTLGANLGAETVFSGPLLLAIPIAALAGLLSFLSPCVLPLVPGYLGYVTGLAGADLAQRRRGRMLAGVGLFVLGFSVVFVLAGVVFAQIGASLQADRYPWVLQILGVVIIMMGVVFMGGFRFLQREARIHSKPPAGIWAAPVLGLTFGLGWAPCMGPTLSAVLALAWGSGADATRGAVLAFVYCLGLGVPFLLVALAFGKATKALAFFRRHQLAVMRIGGAVLIVLGLLMATGLWGHWMSSLQGWFQNSAVLPL
jgi:cytochrome c-type biogenesis protein